ncbi:monooxygenase [Hyaloscypha variabilis F]|uniref:Monooxygenase n=1 Tax=Hyaloscypha variabilis (strain UAMH 11265 / GT02V1 / F) TaxID=1149755 RepID=A0A2J6RD24_HYAVF|nr:monooxygenase [Hyaloscypha variabilis F]
MATRPSHNNAAVVIVGAGISGMCTAIDMMRRNGSRDFVILEKGSQVGGTWNDNQYPGCCSDVWSHLYSYSFDSNPSWSREYPGQEEIHTYLVDVAERWGLFRHLRFNTAVKEATWNEETKQWNTRVQICGEKEVEFAKEYTIASDFLVSGVGQLNMPQYPAIPGINNFQGKMMHSARWDWSYDLEGKKVAIIGNGATAAQIIPEIAKVCDTLTVFQRTPNWVVPRGDAPISERMRTIYKYVPLVRKRYRAHLMDLREQFFEAAIVDDSEANNRLRADSLAMMECQIPENPELRARLTPNYPPGCKRVILSDDIFPALNQKHVSLETHHIKQITKNGIKVEGQDLEFDLIILATGFRTLEFMYPIKITGAGGRSIQDIWKDGARAYLGVTVESLPNFGMLYGPNTNLGHNSIILMIEAQSHYINTLIAPVLAAKKQHLSLAITPNTTRLEEYNAKLQSRLKNLTFSSSKCDSWYKNADGLVTNNWCGTVVEYQMKLSELNWGDFDLSGTGKSIIVSPEKRVHLGRVVEETRVSLLGLGAVIIAAAITVRLMSQTSIFHALLSKVYS